MKFQIIFFTLAAVLLGGCADLGFAPLPESASHIELVGLSSPKINVHPPELRFKASKFELSGAVAKAFGADTTEHTRLTVSFCDQTGRLLQSAEVDFSPRRLESYRRSIYHRGHYKLSLDALPPGTKRIEVRAHE